MGIFNDTASIDAFAINAYCIVSALFFSACAYAQLNDPNPVQWFCAYVVGGTLPNLYWMTTGSSPTTLRTRRVVLALHGYVAVVATAIVYKLVVVAPKLLAEAEEHHHGILWAYMEHEEGRDSIGLLLLILHASYLRSVLARGPARGTKVGRSSSPRNSSAALDADAVAAAGDAARAALRAASQPPVLPPALVALLLVAVLGGCVYVWIVHHPELVAKHGLKHCQGEMFGRDGGEL